MVDIILWAVLAKKKKKEGLLNLKFFRNFYAATPI